MAQCLPESATTKSTFSSKKSKLADHNPTKWTVCIAKQSIEEAKFAVLNVPHQLFFHEGVRADSDLKYSGSCFAGNEERCAYAGTLQLSKSSQREQTPG